MSDALDDIKARIDAVERALGCHVDTDLSKLVVALEAVQDLANNYRMVEDQQIFDVIAEALA